MTTRTPWLFPFAAAAALFAGCTAAPPALTPGPSGQERLARFQINDDEYAKIGYRRDWIGFPFVSGGSKIHTLKPYADAVLVQESGSAITLLDANNGSLKWSNLVAGPLTKFVGAERYMDPDRGEVVLSFTEGEVFILAGGTGNLIGRQQLDKVVNTPPVFYGDLAVFGSPTGEVFAHSISRGAKQWGHASGTSIRAPLADVGGGVLAVQISGSLLGLDAGSGAVLGRGRMWAGLETSPITVGDLAIFASLDQSVYAFTLDGTQVWRFRTSQPLKTQPVANRGVVYVTTDRGLTALDAFTGSFLWAAKDVTGVAVGSRHGNILVWDGMNMAALDANTGTVNQRVRLPGIRMIVSDRFDDGNLFVASESGVIVKFRPRQ